MYRAVPSDNHPNVVTFTGYEFDPYDHIIVVTGKKRSGKSQLAKELSKGFKRVIVWDYNWEHTGKEFGLFSIFEKTTQPIIVHDLKSLQAAWTRFSYTEPRRVIYQPRDKSKNGFNEFCKFINNNIVYACIYIEEAQNVMSANSIPPEFETLEASGRHRKCGLLITCRSNKRIPTRLFDDADYLFIFKQKRPESYEYIAEYVSEMNVELLKESPDYYYVMLAPDGNDFFMRPLTVTVPSA